jgi:hypothetical protein
MAKRILHIVDSAYRATIEEQDDTVIWFTHVMKGAGADVALLLRGNAVNYAVEGQDASGLSFGGRRQTQPPTLDGDIAKLAAKGVELFYVEEDAQERGIQPTDLVGGPKGLSRKELAPLLARYDLVFSW